MNCLEFRQHRLADPRVEDALLDAHRSGCSTCARFEVEVKELDARLHQALAVPVPDGLAARILLNQSFRERPVGRLLKWGVAATVVLGIGFGVVQLSRSPEVVEPLLAHAAHQPHEFYGSEHQPVSNQRLESLLTDLGLETSLDDVVYAAVCPFEGENAVHLVIRDAGDQYTVMLLPDQSPRRMFTIDTDTWRGYISPHPAGALAILATSSDAKASDRLREVRDHLQQAIYLTAGR